jgi:DNA-binding PadR family transcriptional regulator
MTLGSRRLGKTGVLGAFEELVLLALLHQDQAASPVSVRRDLAERLGSDVAMGAVYATLDRLVGKQMARIRETRSIPTGPGRPRTYFEILPDGLAALEQTRRIRRQMWRGISLPASAARRWIT